MTEQYRAVNEEVSQKDLSREQNVAHAYEIRKPKELTFKTDQSKILKTLDCFD